jgi:hypothetical protein
MWTSDGIVLVYYVAAEFLEAVSHLLSSMRIPVRDTNIACMVGKMVANHRSVLASLVNDLHK